MGLKLLFFFCMTLFKPSYFESMKCMQFAFIILSKDKVLANRVYLQFKLCDIYLAIDKGRTNKVPSPAQHTATSSSHYRVSSPPGRCRHMPPQPYHLGGSVDSIRWCCLHWRTCTWCFVLKDFVYYSAGIYIFIMERGVDLLPPLNMYEYFTHERPGDIWHR